MGVELMLKRLIIIICILLLTSCSNQNEEDFLNDTSPDLDQSGFNIDQENINDMTILRPIIVIVELVEFIGTLPYADDSIYNVYSEVTFTHYKAKVLYVLKGEVTDEIIDLIILGGLNDQNQFEYRFGIIDEPELNQVFLIYAEENVQGFVDNDNRIFLNGYNVSASEFELILLNNYQETADVKDQQADIREIIREAEKAVEDTKDMTLEDLVID